MSNVAIEIDIAGVVFSADVIFDFVGQHYPETPTSPEEFPEMEIYDIILGTNPAGFRIKELLDNPDFAQSIQELVEESIEP